MTFRGALGQIWADLTGLFSRQDRGFWFLFVAAILLQIAYWYLASPGPRLLGLEPRLPETAFRSVLWSLVLLVAVPYLLLRLLRSKPSYLHVAVGRAAEAVPVVLVASVMALPLVYLITIDPGIQAWYPWPGPWVESSVIKLVIWSGIYLLHFSAFEFFYRAFFFRLIEREWGTFAGLWIQALAATLITLGKPLPEVLATLPLSLLLGVTYVRSRSLIYPIALHWLIGVSTDVFSLYHQNLLFP